MPAGYIYSEQVSDNTLIKGFRFPFWWVSHALIQGFSTLCRSLKAKDSMQPRDIALDIFNKKMKDAKHLALPSVPAFAASPSAAAGAEAAAKDSVKPEDAAGAEAAAKDSAKPEDAKDKREETVAAKPPAAPAASTPETSVALVMALLAKSPAPGGTIGSAKAKH